MSYRGKWVSTLIVHSKCKSLTSAEKVLRLTIVKYFSVMFQFPKLTLRNILNDWNGQIIGLIQKVQQVIPRLYFLAIYTIFKRPHLDYGDLIFDQDFNDSFHQKMEAVLYDFA